MPVQITAEGTLYVNGGGIQIPEMWFQALLPFPALLPERTGELAHRLGWAM